MVGIATTPDAPKKHILTSFMGFVFQMHKSSQRYKGKTVFLSYVKLLIALLFN